MASEFGIEQAAGRFFEMNEQLRKFRDTAGALTLGLAMQSQDTRLQETTMAFWQIPDEEGEIPELHNLNRGYWLKNTSEVIVHGDRDYAAPLALSIGISLYHYRIDLRNNNRQPTFSLVIENDPQQAGWWRDRAYPEFAEHPLVAEDEDDMFRGESVSAENNELLHQTSSAMLLSLISAEWHETPCVNGDLITLI